MSFKATDPASHNSENCWYTPLEIVGALGPFSMDVCTMSTRPFNIAEKHIEHDKGEDSLSIEWEGFVWMNPPYGKEIAPFISKFKKHKNGIALVCARMGTPWMQDWINDGGKVFFLRKRIIFIDKHNKRANANAGTDSCLLFNGEEARLRIVNSELKGVFSSS